MNFNAALPFAAAAAGAGLVIATLIRPHRTVATWAFAAGIVVLAAESLLVGLSAAGHTPGSAPSDRWLGWQFAILSVVPGLWILFSVTYARGVTRRLLSRRPLLIVAAIALPLAFTLAYREALAFRVTLDGQQFIRLGWPGLALHGLLLIGSIIVLMNLERTYRASVGTIRWRIKFMLIGVGILFIVRVYTSSQSLLFRGADPLVDSVNSGALLVAVLLFIRSLLRDSQLNLEVYPSQSLLQNSLTALLAGVYLLFVGVFAKIVALFGGDSTFALKAFLGLVSLVLLALLLQSDHVRLHLRRFVSRNFQRPLYDYRQTWIKFTDRTASCVEQAELCRVLVRLFADTFQVLSVSIWIVEDQKNSIVRVASTSSSDPNEVAATTRKTELAHLIEFFGKHPEPVDIETSTQPWASSLRDWHQAEFIRGGHRVAVPIIGRGEVLGVIVVGDRVGGVTFSLQDFEMLKCACDHAAASLLNVQLSRRLLQSKELEAFQTMAAFFVHDLKNAASTLNLMLQNLPEHFADPAFREDALRGASKTVNHINHLIGRLGMLRHELKIHATVGDLNAVIENSLAGLDSGPGYTLTKKLSPLPKFPFDPDQIGKVVINLALNAREAIQGTGQVVITTSQQGSWAVLTVKDSGCGMSADFINRSLFRPFQTTKKSGLGIGMFQSKTIVEAHGGRITVSSEPKQGTTFQVHLPIP